MGGPFSKPIPKLPEPTLPRSSSTPAQHESSDTVKRESAAECRAFQRCFADLAGGILNPGWLAIQLYSRKLIGPDLRTEAQKEAIEERVKIEKLLLAVEKQIVDSPATVFSEFLGILQNEPSLEDLATKLKNTHRELVSKPSLTSTPSSPPADTYAFYLKSVYAREQLPIYDKWPQVKSTNYINLALVEKQDITKREADEFARTTIHGNIDDINKSKRAICIGRIAQLPDGSQPKCIVVEGAPGVGKSTLAWKLCHEWGKGKLLQEYQLVVLLRFRDKSVRAAKTVSDLFQYHQYYIQQAAVKEIQGKGGKSVLLVFEGYDELPEELRTKNSIFLDVITQKVLPEATVLITSRPWASGFLHMEHKRQISQRIEVLGFTKANIGSYLENATVSDPTLLADLKKYISCYPHICSLMYIPLNSAIVVEVYRNSRKDKILVPKTMTELYSSLIRSLLLRYLLEHPEHGKRRNWRVRSFSDLPQDVYQQLCELARIAYEGILHEQQVIFSDLPEHFETLGLMQCDLELYADEGVAVSYNFLHLTLQEYLAAFHLSQQPLNKQIEHFTNFCTDKTKKVNRHFHTVLRFLSGIKKFYGYQSEVLKTLFVETVESCHDPASVIHIVTINTLHWLFEAQDKNIIANLLGSPDIHFHTLYVVTPFDCFVLGYCVSHSNCSWRIDLDYRCIGDEGVDMLVRGTVEEKTNCTGGISGIILSRNQDITSEGLEHLSSFPKQSVKKLETLSLLDNKLDSESCAALSYLIPYVPHLKKLLLSFNPNIGQGNAVPLIMSLTANKTVKTLNELWLSNTGIGVEDCRALSQLLSSSTSLKELDIRCNNLPPKAVELVVSGLLQNTTLERLHLSYSHFSLQNTISLASVLMTNHTLLRLNLRWCNIESDGACQLANSLHTNDTLLWLSLWYNPVGVEGAAAFAEMLPKNTSLKVLDLRDDSIGKKGTQILIDSLTHNTTLKELTLPKKYQSSIASSVDSRVDFFVANIAI